MQSLGFELSSRLLQAPRQAPVFPLPWLTSAPRVRPLLSIVVAVLRRHEASLRAIFDVLSAASRVRKHVSLEIWLAFLHAAELISVDVSDREAVLCFGWSRPVVHDEQSAAGKVKATCLPFEGFCEALCRVATLKALPTLAEVDAAGEPDAGAFLLNLRDESGDQFAAFLAEPRSRIEWGDEPRGESVAQRVEHLLHLIIRIVEGNNVRDSNMRISSKEMGDWAKRCME